MNTKKSKILIIAEAGVNHNGNIKLALKMVDIAANLKLILLNFKHIQQMIWFKKILVWPAIKKKL